MAANHALLVEDFKRAQADVLAARRAGVVRENALVAQMREAIQAGDMRPTDFDFGKLFIACYGYHDFLQCKEGKQSAQEVFQRVSESDAGVTTAAFQNISGQIIYSGMTQEYKSEDFVFAKLIPEDKALILDGEKMAGITEMGDVGAIRKEGDPYQEAGVGEDWIFTPPVPDRGAIVSITWEAVFNDRTGRVMEKAGNTGYWLGYGEEVQAIDCMIDENSLAHRYNWRTFGPMATYQDNTGTHTFDNLTAANPLVDWTSINAAEQTLNQVVNPYTGTPILVEPTHLVVTKQLEQTARRIVNATEINVVTPGFATSGAPTKTAQANPYRDKYEILTSRLLAQRMAVKTSWFLVNPAEAFLRKVAEPLNAVREPSNSKDDFERRIVGRFRANKRYAHVTREPRVAHKSTAA